MAIQTSGPDFQFHYDGSWLQLKLIETRVLHPVGNIIFKEGPSSLDMKIFKNFNES
jgi:hypothetical protein